MSFVAYLLGIANMVAVIFAHLRINDHQRNAGAHLCGHRGPYSGAPCVEAPGHPYRHRSARGWTWGGGNDAQ